MRKALSRASHGYTDITREQFRKNSFIAPINLVKACFGDGASHAAFSGLSSMGGETLQIMFEGITVKCPGLFGRRCSTTPPSMSELTAVKFRSKKKLTRGPSLSELARVAADEVRVAPPERPLVAGPYGS